jgi:hypothetical protein
MMRFAAYYGPASIKNLLSDFSNLYFAIGLEILLLSQRSINTLRSNIIKKYFPLNPRLFTFFNVFETKSVDV